MTTGPRSRHLVASELQAALSAFPQMDFSKGIEPFRSSPFDLSTLPPLSEALQAVDCTERLIPGAQDALTVRLLHYTPPGRAIAPRPAVLHMHGGGYILGTPEINDRMNRAIALAQDCVVVSVDYRLAPETIWPGALMDDLAA